MLAVGWPGRKVACPAQRGSIGRRASRVHSMDWPNLVQWFVHHPSLASPVRMVWVVLRTVVPE